MKHNRGKASLCAARHSVETAKGVIELLLCIILIPAVFAAHSAAVTTTYVPIYETNPVNITINVQNSLFSAASINKVDIQKNGFTIISTVPLLGWALNNSIFSTSTNAISNWGSQNFGFATTALNVNQDTTYNWTVITTDTSNGQQVNLLQLTVLNDNTPPILGTIQPGPFNLGKNNEAFSIAATDPQTGIANANLHLSNCDLIYNNVTNTSSTVYTTYPITCTNGVCSTTQDLSSWPEGDICYYFDVSNNGGGTALSANQTSIIDRTPPTVSLTSPLNNSFLNVTTVPLVFDANDNYDTNPACIISVNSATYVYNATAGSNSYNLPVNDGIYSWNVACTDEVALTGTSKTDVFTVDNQGPNITMTVPAINNRGAPVLINISITDAGSGVDQSSVVTQITDPNNNVTSVTISNNQISYATTTATQPGTYTIQITAKDNLGHQTTQSIQFRIRETYTITLTASPLQTDASTANSTKYINVSGTVTEDNGSTVTGAIDLIGMIGNQTLTLNQSAFRATLQVPQSNGQYTIIASYVNGIDTFIATATIAVGPYCGNNIVDPGEQCDGSTTALCSQYGYSQGTTSCSASCTIDTSQCSNPPQGGSGGGGGSSSNSVIITSAPAPVVQQPIIPVEDLHSGIVAPIQQQPIQPTGTSGILEPINTTMTVGIGSSWAAFTNLKGGINIIALLAFLFIGILLYMLGWRRTKDENWDQYIQRVRKNYP